SHPRPPARQRATGSSSTRRSTRCSTTRTPARRLPACFAAERRESLQSRSQRNGRRTRTLARPRFAYESAEHRGVDRALSYRGRPSERLALAWSSPPTWRRPGAQPMTGARRLQVQGAEAGALVDPVALHQVVPRAEPHVGVAAVLKLVELAGVGAE